MRRSILAMAGALTLLVVDVGLAQESTDTALRIGTFDSRAVALAYYRSSEGLERMKPEWDKELRDAEAAGDLSPHRGGDCRLDKILKAD